MADRTNPLVSLLLIAAVLIVYANVAPWLNKRGYGNSNVMKAESPPGLVALTLDKQLRNGAKTWTPEEYLRKQIPDLIDDLTEQERRWLLDGTVKGNGAECVLSMAQRRKLGEPLLDSPYRAPNRDPLSTTRTYGPILPDFTLGFEGAILRYHLMLQENKDRARRKEQP